MTGPWGSERNYKTHCLRKYEGAYVEVALLGNAPSEDYNKLTGQICDMLSQKLGIPGSAIYVTYHPLADWGWNGSNF
ncbi:MAG: hypothetical protein J6P36_08280 [Lachnospiraceae bacterium]|nr:hypothetical protein [Lachnospiraceae bacterium]MBO7649681.1 hypothetical protein [Lachnospiraceae bacterium]